MTEIKITRKDLYARIAEVMSDDAEVVELCTKQIAALSKPRKVKENTEAIEFANGVASAMADFQGPATNAELAAAVECSPQKMAAALRRLVAEGVVIRTEGEKSKDKATFVLA